MSQYHSQLSAAFPDLSFVAEQPLAQYTAVKIGGPAEVFCQLSSSAQVEQVIKFCISEQIPYTMLGWGANTLISDAGIRGLVIRVISQSIEVLNAGDVLEIAATQPAARWAADAQRGSFTYEFSDINYSEDDAARVPVVLDAGVPLSFATTSLLKQGITGLQWYARIPATIGGAVYNNIHGGTHFLSEVVTAVDLITASGEKRTIPATELDFGYDYSRFHVSDEVILRVHMSLYKGDVERATQVFTEWGKRKAQQPSRSLGCVFQNISSEVQQRLNLPTPSVGYIIEHVLHRKGWQLGGAKVSEYHAAFIENTGSASAAEYLEIIKTIIAETQQKLDIRLQCEIFFLGFTKEELQGVTYE